MKDKRRIIFDMTPEEGEILDNNKKKRHTRATSQYFINLMIEDKNRLD